MKWGRVGDLNKLTFSGFPEACGNDSRRNCPLVADVMNTNDVLVAPSALCSCLTVCGLDGQDKTSRGTSFLSYFVIGRNEEIQQLSFKKKKRFYLFVVQLLDLVLQFVCRASPSCLVSPPCVCYAPSC